MNQPSRELFDAGRRGALVKHPVAVRTDQSQIAETGAGLADRSQRHDVVALDVARPMISVGPAELETARFTRERTGVGQHVVLLPVGQPSVPFPNPMPAEQQSPLIRQLFILERRQGLRKLLVHLLPYRSRRVLHSAGICGELFPNLPVSAADVSHPPARVSGIYGGEIRELQMNAVGIAEAVIAPNWV